MGYDLAVINAFSDIEFLGRIVLIVLGYDDANYGDDKHYYGDYGDYEGADSSAHLPNTKVLPQDH